MLLIFTGNLVKSPGQHGDLTERADRGGIAICECGFRIADFRLRIVECGFGIFNFESDYTTLNSAYCRCQSSIYASTNHRDTESTEKTIFFARSGDGDRAKDRSPPGTI